MDATKYQVLASRTLLASPGFNMTDREAMLVWCTFGIAGETGEVVEHVKKGVFHRHGIDDDIMMEEIGDCLWYLAGICSVMGYNLGGVMERNIEKLEKRYPDGFSPENSKNRIDTTKVNNDEQTR